MSYLKRFFKFVCSRHTLVFVAIVLVAAAVWFIGPLLAFGDYRPFDSVSSRAIVIVVLLALLLFGLLRWSPAPIVVAIVGLLLWHLGPLLAFGSVRPLAPTWSRVLLVSALVACYAVYGLYRLWHAMRNNDALLQRILNPFASRATPEQVARDELRVVQSAVSRALDRLRRMRSGSSGWRRLFENQRYLYELPWYMVVGSPGAGKTTLVLNSGLDFPDAAQMNASSIRERVETANCDWWFTNEAVLIDTAGRYTVQDGSGASPGSDAGPQTKPDAAAVNAAEWRGFLDLLRKRRPRAPINGALLVVSVEELLNRSPANRTTLAAAMRARLGELRQQLGVRFPVYVLVTKLDLLPGFAEYFQSLTGEGRSQVLGFTLGYRQDGGQDGEPEGAQDLRQRCAAETRLLEHRLEEGINVRLQEEYEGDRRKKLYAFPGEFRSLAAQLLDMIGLVFLDSRYDDTQLGSLLRGVYFTSAAQTNEVIPADRTTLLQRLRRGLAGITGEVAAAVAPASATASAAASAPTVYRGYFLRSLFQRVILAEGHLVRPNLRWEFRFRTLRVVGHLLSVVVAVWLIGALIVSFGNNRDYLAAIGKKTDALAQRVGGFRKVAQPGAMAGVLSASRDLPQYRDLDLDSPGGAYRYGLYTAPPVVDASDTTYANLLTQMLLPQVSGRLEAVLETQLRAGDADGVYRTLSIYLMLYEAAHYDAKAVKAWVLDDWEHAGTGAAMGDRSAMARHLDALFTDGQRVTPRAPLNADLVQRARDFLDRNPVAGRLYERAVADMQKDAPDNITLTRAAGPQAAAVFALVAGSTLERGVPGLYTYDGYHDVFNRRLPEFLAQAQTRDAWVMGRDDAGSKLARQAIARVPGADRDKLADEVRRQYLTDYGNYWQQFLDDIRPLNGSPAGGIALDLQALRTLSAPESPLVKLARTAVHETSLTLDDGPDDPSLTDAAVKALGRRSRAVRAASAVAGAAATITQIAQQKLEKELVDNRFAALRQVVTGQADTGSGPALAGGATVGGSTLRLDDIMGLLNEQYSRLSMAGNVLATNAMPPPDDIGGRLQMEATRLPAPFRALLSGIASQSMQKVDQGVGSLLALQVDTSVGDTCRRAIEGRYPFAAGTREVDIGDFNRVFAPGGLLDDFFQKTLANHVDTSLRPWRYRPVSPGMPTLQGPSLEPFERAAAIRQAFFRDGARMDWEIGIRVASMDPDITELLLDIDGQTMRYVHGPVKVFPVAWPGPRGGSMASITANPPVRSDTSTALTDGPWALFRLFDRGRPTRTSAGRPAIDFDFDNRHVVLELASGGQSGPYAGSLLKGFRCPGTGGAARSVNAASRSSRLNESS
ncbi:type VI secretion system membrane subunit TssM [Paraburkholderia caballeronis]|uniref:type VI secretion system membrane subunit TssM n=1 Tax=Paraburkholderia caballeronis TaxID=416943 RepID=UPI001064DCDD|nr:type VI secretion system membrane subunit TssM [Paraburkholderia caballeronis]TDV16449.1 type VI secretion system protein ImpL [Paraburkholderia caballeronis]TDV18845.1 type VI secretion system protein ImpL [Paraburkholderia caballeronis]TDV26978.1 type VI secretion system protein ImpL [Paraburkholderia caballeronis]